AELRERLLAADAQLVAADTEPVPADRGTAQEWSTAARSDAQTVGSPLASPTGPNEAGLRQRLLAPAARLPWGRLARAAAALLVVGAAFALARSRFPELRQAMDRFLPERAPRPRMRAPRPRSSSPPAPEAQAPAPPRPSASADGEPQAPSADEAGASGPTGREDGSTSSGTAEAQGTPADGAPPAEASPPAGPAPLRPPPPEPPTADPPVAAATGRGTHTRPPTERSEPAEVDLVALRRLHRRILDARLPAVQRPHLLESLGEDRFAHPSNYRFLARVLAGSLDALPDAEGSRRAALGALARLSTPEAAAVLLEAPLREGRREADEAALLAAMRALRGPGRKALADGLLRARGLDLARAFLAVEALGANEAPEGLPALATLLRSEGRAGSLRRAAAETLGRLRTPDALAPLREGLADRDWRVRQGAARGLGLHAVRVPAHAADCARALGNAAADPQDPVAEAALDALGATRHGAALEPLLAALEDKRPRLRARARWLLSELTDPPRPAPHGASAWRELLRARGLLAPGASAALPPARPLEERDPTSFRREPGRAHAAVFLVDASGSMRAKWDAARFELRKALEACPPEVRFQVIFFGDAPRPLWPRRALAPATAANVARALAACEAQSLGPGVRTGLGPALRLALEHREADCLYLISDGLEPGLTAEEAARLLRRASWERARPLRLHAVHVRFGGRPVRLVAHGSPADPEDVRFLRRLAALGDGLYARN
ncbi:MAG: VWA domain-containing protein, partial [Planctomycetota bacterium]